jgi:hypothetical protein
MLGQELANLNLAALYERPILIYLESVVAAANRPTRN